MKTAWAGSRSIASSLAHSCSGMNSFCSSFLGWTQPQMSYSTPGTWGRCPFSLLLLPESWCLPGQSMTFLVCPHTCFPSGLCKAAVKIHFYERILSKVLYIAAGLKHPLNSQIGTWRQHAKRTIIPEGDYTLAAWLKTSCQLDYASQKRSILLY